MKTLYVLLFILLIYKCTYAQDTIKIVTRGKVLIIDSLKSHKIQSSYSHFGGPYRLNLKMIVELDTIISCSNRLVLGYNVKYGEKLSFIEGKRYKFIIQRYNMSDLKKNILLNNILSHCHFIVAFTNPYYMINAFEEE